ncbi:MAG: quinone-dependent dihydroorotate dehydrogenase [Coxiellaceae bacterium]|nr:quinone-dependent dihydroorotate dehydrogenase [Coxiellaceae bacterium]
MYSLFRPLLFRLSPDNAHHLTISCLKYLPLWLCRRLQRKTIHKPVELFGLRFNNAIGLAAGFDKDGEAIDALLAMGFGFIEVGAVTPKPQPGNPRPHVKRYVEHENVVNACGFNNKGVDHLVQRLKARQLPGIVGVNIGKNKDTPNDKAVEDYRICLQRVYAYADFVTINVSSPNTQNLRDIQQQDMLDQLLAELTAEAEKLQQQHNKKTPLLVKVSPDLTNQEISDIAACLLRHSIDGVIATNTTLQHSCQPGLAEQNLPGGLSGPAVCKLSRHVLQQLQSELQGKLPIISVGGIDSVEEAQWRLEHGASLVQVYTALIFKGLGLVRQIAQRLG